MYKANAAQDQVAADVESRQNEVDDTMNQHPGMRELQRQMQGVISRAEESGDADKEEGGAILRDMLNNEAGSYLKYFMVADDEDKDQILKEIKTLMINLARKEQADNKLAEFPDGDLDLSDEATEASSSRDAAKSKIDMMQRMLGDRHDKNLGMQDAPKLEAGKDYPKKVEGEKVTYNLKQKERAPNQSFWTSKANTALRETDANFRNPQTFVSVDWDVTGTDEEDGFDVKGNRKNLSAGERKRTSLDALKTWRNDVLPQLQPGMVLLANPIDDEEDKQLSRKDGRNQRERIYQLAGFGKSQDDVIGAVVIRDEEGNNKLVPLSPTKEQEEREKKINETYIDLIGSDLNNLEVEVVYNMLFS